MPLLAFASLTRAQERSRWPRRRKTDRNSCTDKAGQKTGACRLPMLLVTVGRAARPVLAPLVLHTTPLPNWWLNASWMRWRLPCMLAEHRRYPSVRSVAPGWPPLSWDRRC